MKKILYTALLVLASVLSFTACTEEDVAPISETENGGGNGEIGKI